MNATTENQTLPNPQLVEALRNSSDVFNYKDHLECQMKWLCKEVQCDSFDLRPAAYSRHMFTVAMLLAKDNILRTLAAQNHVDLRAFDNAVGQVQQLILTLTNKPAPAAKIAAVLDRKSVV